MPADEVKMKLPGTSKRKTKEGGCPYLSRPCFRSRQIRRVSAALPREFQTTGKPDPKAQVFPWLRRIPQLVKLPLHQVPRILDPLLPLLSQPLDLVFQLSDLPFIQVVIAWPVVRLMIPQVRYPALQAAYLAVVSGVYLADPALVSLLQLAFDLETIGPFRGRRWRARMTGSRWRVMGGADLGRGGWSPGGR